MSDAISSWTFQGYENKPVIVEVYAAGDAVELFLNDEPLGKKIIGEEDQNVNTDVNCKISVEIEGDGELLGVGSGNPKSEESFLGNCTYTWNGRALAIVKKGKGRSLIVFTTEDGGSARIEI